MKRAIAAAALVAVLAAAAATLAGGDGERPTRAATISTATTEIRRQDLVDEESEDGKLGHSDSREVVNRLSGTITWLPEEGAVVRPDQRLFEVDGAPVVLMSGSVPAYRALSASVSDGPDVAELERSLRELGYDSGGAITLDDSWDAGTTAAVDRWQEAHGLPVTGSIELGRVIFQPGRRRVESLAVTLGGSAQGGGNGGEGNGGDGSSGASSIQPLTPRTVFASYTAPPKKKQPPADGENKRQDDLDRRERELERREADLEKRERELERSPSTQQPQSPQQAQPAQSDSSDRSAEGAADGDASASAVASQVMSTTSTRPVVTVDLDTAKESIAKRGATVTVDLPDGGRARGRISSVGKVATTESSDSQSDEPASDAATVKVTIRLAKRIAALDDAPVTVNFERERRRDVLAIPVTALLARSGGRFAVEVRDGGRRRIVPVTPGLYTSGYVEIEGRGLRAGMKVTDARV